MQTANLKAIEKTLSDVEPSAQLANLFILLQGKMIAHYHGQGKGDAEISALLSLNPKAVETTRNALGIGDRPPAGGDLGDLVGWRTTRDAHCEKQANKERFTISPARQQMFAAHSVINQRDIYGKPVRVKPEGDPIWETANAIRDGISEEMLIPAEHYVGVEELDLPLRNIQKLKELGIHYVRTLTQCNPDNPGDLLHTGFNEYGMGLLKTALRDFNLAFKTDIGTWKPPVTHTPK